MNTIYQVPSLYSAPGTAPEQLRTLKQAAESIGCHLWQIQRAVKRREIPSYTPFNSRRLVKLSEVVAYIDATRQGGAL